LFGFRKGTAQRIIDSRFAEGEHYVGDWHTHPQDHPIPSTIDHATMASRFSKSDHGLNSMVFCIVGRSPFPDGIAVMIHNGRECLWLKPAKLAPP
jgi:integrative and conjugative element protein (TIGR02256 family)